MKSRASRAKVKNELHLNHHSGSCGSTRRVDLRPIIAMDFNFTIILYTRSPEKPMLEVQQASILNSFRPSILDHGHWSLSQDLFTD